MPVRPKHPCNWRGCKELTNGRFCPEHTSMQRRDDDALRGTRTERGYSNKWLKARTTFLREHPLCVMCAQQGLSVEACEVDHIVRHQQNWDLFWDQSNWQSLCGTCHKRKTLAERREKR